jgi:putative oxidoreductase
MNSPLNRLQPYAYAVLRMVAGVLFMFHGLQKFGMFGGQAVELGSRLSLAAFIELIGGVFIAVGFLTVPTAFVASGETAFAYFLAHQPRGGWPIQNGGELAALYCFLFLFVATSGSGRFALDGTLRRR